jgi:uncharacterized protein (TIGR00725 family)
MESIRESSRGPEIAVAGSGSLLEADPRWTQAYQLGQLLAQQGFTVVTGSYQGLMEAVSRGVAAAGGHAVGLPVRSWEFERPNPWNTELRWSASFGERMDRLLQCQALVVLPGGLGTLAELAMFWAAFQWKPRLLILLGEDWPPVTKALREHLLIPETALTRPSFAATPEDVVRQLGALSGTGPDHA